VTARVHWAPAGTGVPLGEVPDVPAERLAGTCAELKAGGARLVAMVPLAGVVGRGELDVLVVVADDVANRLGMLRARFQPGRPYPAVTAALPEAQAFERELWEDCGVVPEGHPWLKPLRRHPELAGGGATADRGTARYPFFQVEGPGIHEVAVGPVHAGIIEPGHFRLQCRGEEVLSLEIHLGYQHRDAERALVGATPARRLAIAESVAGDGTVGHVLAHCLALEALAGAEPPLAAQVLRGVGLELERIAAHVGDLGALAGDVGYLPGAAWFGRLRGEFLNLLMEVSGSRFGRGLVVPGGVRFGLGAPARDALLERLAAAERDLGAAAAVLFDAASVLSRFEGTGVVTSEVAEGLGLVGPAARASGVSRDARRDHPHGIYRFAIIPVSAGDSGDVMARAMVRWLEVQRSLVFVREQLAELRGGPWVAQLPAARPGIVAAAVVEGWRGEIVHVAATASDGALSAYRIVDPSFHNWFGLAMALRGNQVSDFPLCNKSFSLSYAGHDR
jgi:Ni,Fe-hydrogenase III large subunit